MKIGKFELAETPNGAKKLIDAEKLAKGFKRSDIIYRIIERFVGRGLREYQKSCVNGLGRLASRLLGWGKKPVLDHYEFTDKDLALMSLQARLNLIAGDSWELSGALRVYDTQFEYILKKVMTQKKVDVAASHPW